MPESARVQLLPPSRDKYKLLGKTVTAASTCPSADEATSAHCREVSREVQLAPPSVEISSVPPSWPAIRCCPSAEEAMSVQSGPVRRSVQLAPPSLDVKRSPSRATAARRRPSADEAMPSQKRLDSVSVHGPF